MCSKASGVRTSTAFTVESTHDQLMQWSSCLKRRQQKVQPASRMEISRDGECDEPQVVQGFPEDRQGHSHNHVEEACAMEPDKRKDRTFHDDVHDAPPHTKKHSTSWRFDLVLPWRLDHLRGSRQDTHGHWAVTTEGRYDGRPLRRKAVRGSTSRACARDTSHRHKC